ncbi:MAG: protein kinase [Polyangiaceae bacterium]
MLLPSSDADARRRESASCPDEATMLAFVEGRLSPAERGGVDIHLSECSECRQLVSALAQGGLVLGDTRNLAGGSSVGPVATAVLDPSPFRATPSPDPRQSAPPMPAASLLRPGDRIADRYVVVEPIGSGGMGVVVAAKHLGLGRTFAVKLLDPRYTGSTEATARFLREARASAQLQGEHVVQVTDTGETILPNGTKAPFLVMELLVGTDLSKQTAQKRPLPTPEAVWLVLQACEALAEAHRLGIVHRDIKPANLIVTRKVDGTPHLKVVDFGISKAHDIARSLGSLTSQNVVMGTPRYMAPEQMRSSKDVDGRADVWALGCVLYELLAGAPAFDAPTLTELITRVQLEEPPPLTSVAPHVPVELARVVHACLRKDVAQRVASVADLAESLAPFAPPAALHHVERSRRRMGGSRPSLKPSVPVSARTSKAPTKQRSLPLATLGLSIGGILVGALVTVIVVLLRDPDRPTSVTVPVVAKSANDLAKAASASSPSLPSNQNATPDLSSLGLTPPPDSTSGGALGGLSPKGATPGAGTHAVRAASSASAAPSVSAPAHASPALSSPPATPSGDSPDDPHNLRQRQ